MQETTDEERSIPTENGSMAPSPSNPDHSSHSFDHNIDPAMQNNHAPHNHNHQDPHPRNAPIPVDFTSHFTQQLRNAAATTTPPSSAVPSKRTFSTSERKTPSAAQAPDPYPHAQNSSPKNNSTGSNGLGTSHGHGNDNIDPSLQQRLDTRSPSMPGIDREARRMELRREAERMREMLLAKERELEELGVDES